MKISIKTIGISILTTNLALFGLGANGAMIALAAPEETYTAAIWQQIEPTVRKPFNPLTPVRIFDHGNTINSVAFSPDDQLVLTGSQDGTASLWDAVTGKKIRSFAANGFVGSAVFTTDGKYILLGAGKSVEYYDVATGVKLDSFSPGGSPAVIAPNGKYMLTGLFGEEAVLWQTTTKKLIRSFSPGGVVSSVAFSPDSKQMLIVSIGRVQLLDVDTGKEMSTFTDDYSGLNSTINSAVFSPSGKQILAGGYNYAVLWDRATGIQLRCFDYDDSADYAATNPVAFSRDGKQVLTVSNKTAVLWDIATGAKLRTFDHEGHVKSAAFSSDGQKVLTSSGEKAELWDMRPFSQILVAKFRDISNRTLCALRDIPSDLQIERETLRREIPIKGEFETSAEFNIRVQSHEQKLQSLYRRVEAFLSQAPTSLSVTEVASIVVQSIREVYGEPFIANVRYDADNETFLADLGPVKARDLGLPKSIALKFPRESAPDFKTKLEASKIKVAFRVTSDGALSFEGVSVDIDNKQYSLPPTDSGSCPTVLKMQVPMIPLDGIENQLK